MKQALATIDPFEPAALEDALKKLIEKRGGKITDLVHPLRVALTGKGVGFGLFDTLAILGASNRVRAFIGRSRDS